jgi:peptidoglycan/xylan/chitin deacetylase (PgdA/CDA1 family)
MSRLPRKLPPILLYHHIGGIERLSRSYLSPELFESHLRHMRRAGFDVVDLVAVVDSVRAGERGNGRTAAITFDDGWRDTYDRAFPLLARYGVPATVFLVAGRIGMKDYLGWKEIREMRLRGMQFGAHSVSHPRLTELSLGEAREEIVACKKMIENGMGEEAPVFCYPYGFFNRAVRDLVEEAGYRGACCNSPGRLWPDGDPFALKRVTMTYRMHGRLRIAAALSGYYVYVKEMRSGNKDYILPASEGTLS